LFCGFVASLALFCGVSCCFLDSPGVVCGVMRFSGIPPEKLLKIVATRGEIFSLKFTIGGTGVTKMSSQFAETRLAEIRVRG